MRGARVWGWGDDPELAERNVQAYLNKRWKATTEEFSITVDGRYENILFEITVYASKPEDLEGLVNSLFDAALAKADKIYFVTVNLYDRFASNEKAYRNTLSFVEEAYERREQNLIQKFKNHPKVKPLLEGGKSLVVIPITVIFCELESERFNKILMRARNCDLVSLLEYIHFLTNKLIEFKIATRILGYDMEDNAEELTILDLDIGEREVFLWLDYPPAK
ncbi:MAG: hypothetical protein FGF51_02685 [Candidatus Brockarchaeota archaeon]|nr:hypothetical protein [Candidatus Brockarchaeota archaeon]MBO3842853.1 hypothetical protein [Candidatus Brockarchaeota archaeon]